MNVFSLIPQPMLMVVQLNIRFSVVDNVFGCMGVGREGQDHSWILKIAAKQGCLLSFEWEKTNFTTFGHP